MKTFTVVVLAAPRIETIALSDGSAVLTWTAIAGASYRVQFKMDLDEASWTDVPGDVIASGATATKVDDSALSTQRFYRVKVLP